MDILQAIGRGFFFLDGGMGTLLQERGLRAGELPERRNLTHADEIVRIHSEYLAAGADAITTNTFGANALKYSDEELKAVIDGALSCARKATDQAGRGYILFDIGPSGKLLRPYGDLDFEDAVELFAKTVRLIGDRADAILIETMNDSYETKAAVLAAKENSSLPVFVTNVYGADGKLMTGADIPAMVALLEGLGVDALGMNCSLGSAQMARLLPQMYAESSVPVIVQPNAGLPREENGKTVYDEDEAFFAENLLSCAKDGARMLGGCCGTTPAYIRRAADTIKGTEPLPVVERATSVASSYTHAVGLGKVPVLIGERINPTGKKLLKQALRDNDVGYILNEALAQEKAGAHILDVNVGLPELDEAETLVRVMCALQEVTALPLQLDSSSPEALARGPGRFQILLRQRPAVAKLFLFRLVGHDRAVPVALQRPMARERQKAFFKRPFLRAGALECRLKAAALGFDSLGRATFFGERLFGRNREVGRAGDRFFEGLTLAFELREAFSVLPGLRLQFRAFRLLFANGVFRGAQSVGGLRPAAAVFGETGFKRRDFALGFAHALGRGERLVARGFKAALRFGPFVFEGAQAILRFIDRTGNVPDHDVHLPHARAGLFALTPK